MTEKTVETPVQEEGPDPGDEGLQLSAKTGS